MKKRAIGDIRLGKDPSEKMENSVETLRDRECSACGGEIEKKISWEKVATHHPPVYGPNAVQKIKRVSYRCAQCKLSFDSENDVVGIPKSNNV